MNKIVGFFIKILPFLPSKKNNTELVHAILYHIGIQCVGVIAVAILFPLAVILGPALILYNAVGILLSVASYFGVELLKAEEEAAE